MTFGEFRRALEAELATSQNPELLRPIRQFNWAMIDELDWLAPLRDGAILDVGASPHGYALERALTRRARRYVGIGLDVRRPQRVVTEGGAVGILTPMDVYAMDFPSESFDAILSVSTFEHLPDPGRALEAMARVLKPGGYLLATADPIWSSARGHHLHQFGACAMLLPPWGHLYLTPAEMRRQLTAIWPADAPIPLAEAIERTYASPDINRRDIVSLRAAFASTSLSLKWTTEQREAPADAAAERRAAAATGLAVADLEVRAITATLLKRRSSWRGGPLVERVERRLRRLYAQRPVTGRVR